MNIKRLYALVPLWLAAASAFGQIETSHFIESGLVEKITKETQSLSDGTEVLCYVIRTKNTPQEHEMGPWVPEKVSDGKDKGGESG